MVMLRQTAFAMGLRGNCAITKGPEWPNTRMDRTDRCPHRPQAPNDWNATAATELISMKPILRLNRPAPTKIPGSREAAACGCTCLPSLMQSEVPWNGSGTAYQVNWTCPIHGIEALLSEQENFTIGESKP